jgi:cation transport regulator ChaC
MSQCIEAAEPTSDASFALNSPRSALLGGMRTNEYNKARGYVFGYGSLMDIDSLRATVPDAVGLMPAFVRGYRREFSVWDEAGFNETNQDVADEPFCALNVRPTYASASRVNGILFRSSTASFERLLAREHAYEPVRTQAHSFYTNESVGDCILFCASRHSGNFDFGSAAQLRYLSVCLRGARRFGPRFSDEFATTTHIDGQSLKSFPGLLTL